MISHLYPTKHCLARFEEKLRTLPPPGNGRGCHTALLSAANLGVRAELPDVLIFQHIRAHVPPGTRCVRDQEIRDAVATARRNRDPIDPSSHPGAGPQKPICPKTVSTAEREAAIAKLLSGVGPVEELDVWERSPIRIDWPPEQDAQRLLEALYAPDEILFLGDLYHAGREYVRPVSDWGSRLAEMGQLHHICPNPLTGEAGLTKSGKPSYRADACVKSFRFCVLEFDDLPKPTQLAFWFASNLPLAALIDTGGKSVHAWVRVDCPDRAAWEQDVEFELFARRLALFGVDMACRNEARLSRLPGVKRKESGRWQRLLYLNPGGRHHE